MQNPIIDAEVSKLMEENQELKDKIAEIEKRIEQNQKTDVHDIKEMMNSIKEFNEKMASLLNRKD
jgi:peptidoglycan hydrolase CwlO-like protein